VTRRRLSSIPCLSRLIFAICLCVLGGVAVAKAGASDKGAHVYMQSGCYACHGELGYGGAGPRFRNDKLLSADEYVVGQILLGRGIMPSFAGLDDDEIAAVATYVRTSWGNKFGKVTPEEVAKFRKSLNPGGPPNPP
jgi:mono/diheme cytochrome c family protein